MFDSPFDPKIEMGLVVNPADTLLYLPVVCKKPRPLNR